MIYDLFPQLKIIFPKYKSVFNVYEIRLRQVSKLNPCIAMDRFIAECNRRPFVKTLLQQKSQADFDKMMTSTVRTGISDILAALKNIHIEKEWVKLSKTKRKFLRYAITKLYCIAFNINM
jgi:hypothetical protein